MSDISDDDLESATPEELERLLEILLYQKEHLEDAIRRLKDAHERAEYRIRRRYPLKSKCRPRTKF